MVDAAAAASRADTASSPTSPITDAVSPSSTPATVTPPSSTGSAAGTTTQPPPPQSARWTAPSSGPLTPLVPVDNPAVAAGAADRPVPARGAASPMLQRPKLAGVPSQSSRRSRRGHEQLELAARRATSLLADALNGLRRPGSPSQDRRNRPQGLLGGVLSAFNRTTGVLCVTASVVAFGAGFGAGTGHGARCERSRAKAEAAMAARARNTDTGSIGAFLSRFQRAAAPHVSTAA